MSDAPKRIWAQDAEPSECNYTGGGWWDDECGNTQYPHMVEYIRADLAPQWHRIDDPDNPPPRDGTEFLGVYVANGKYAPDFSIVEWGGKSWVGKCDGYRSIEAQSDFRTDYHEPFLTHWMPLPQPPQESKT